MYSDFLNFVYVCGFAKKQQHLGKQQISLFFSPLFSACLPTFSFAFSIFLFLLILMNFFTNILHVWCTRERERERIIAPFVQKSIAK